MASNVPKVTFGPTGFVAPSEEDVLAGVLADYDAAFGGGLNLALESPQGQLASSTASIVGEVNDTFVKLANDVDPAYATGRYQDAICRIYNLSRRPAEPTLVDCIISGLAGTIIPVNAVAIAEDGNRYLATGSGAIGVSGTMTMTFACQATGAIACPAGTLNSIYQAIPGWDSITNPGDGVLGNDTESRTDFEARRQASVAVNSRGSLPSIQGAVLAVAGVLDAYVTENTASSPVTVGGTAVAAKSLYVAAVGGTDADVASAIWTKKAPGCGYNGNTTVTVYDDNAAYNQPFPSYAVRFMRPAPLTVLFGVSILNSPLVPADAVAQIQNAVIAAFGGADGGARARIGSSIFATRYVAPIAALGSWAQVSSILVGSNNTAAAVVTGSIGGTVMTVTAVISGALANGQTVSGTGIPDGVRIVSQLSGAAGSTGTYRITNSLTLSSRTITAAIPDRGAVNVNINQVPTIAAPNINVVLV